MAVKVFLILFVTLQAIFHSSATPIDLDIKTVHGDVSAKECHGFQACIGHRLTKVDTINGDLHATEHYNARPGATASATASAGRRRRNINSHQQQNSSETILQTVNGVINGKYAPAPDNEQCLCANNKPGSWICKLGRSFGQDCRCECRPFSVYEPDNLLSIRQKRSPINLRVGTVRGTTSYKRCTSEHPCGGKSPTIDVGHVGGTVIHEVIENGETTIHETIGNNNADGGHHGFKANKPASGVQVTSVATSYPTNQPRPTAVSDCRDLWSVNKCRSRKQKNNCIPLPIRTNCPVTCGLCGSQVDQSRNAGNRQTIKVIGTTANGSEVTRYQSSATASATATATGASSASATATVAVRGSHSQNQNGRVTQGSDATCYDIWQVSECWKKRNQNLCNNKQPATNCRRTCGYCS